MAYFSTAKELLTKFKGGNYLYGINVLGDIGPLAAQFGTSAALIATEFPGAQQRLQTIKLALTAAGVERVEEIAGPAPNAPMEDLSRITEALRSVDPDLVISFGGGSTIDVTKAAEVLRTLGGDIEDYFGTNKVSSALNETDKELLPHVAIQTAASSAAHLTKYSNITNVSSGQKKLIVDEAIIPIQPVFDYSTTFNAPPGLTADGALDGIAHSLEVLYGAVGKDILSAG